MRQLMDVDELLGVTVHRALLEVVTVHRALLEVATSELALVELSPAGGRPVRADRRRPRPPAR